MEYLWALQDGWRRQDDGVWDYDPYWTLEVDRVPRVPDDYLDTVVFIYPTQAAADKGLKTGASGFILCHPAIDGLGWHHYVVTNRHCVENRPQVVIRATVRDDNGFRIKTWKADRKAWIKDKVMDVAIYPLPILDEVAAVPTSTLLRVDQMIDWLVGPGDETFIASRFIHHDGKDRFNHPIIHTGVISMMPLGSIRNPHTKQHEPDFLVEVHSRGGYSGSPVWVYFSPTIDVLSDARTKKGIGPQVALLGTMWGHIKTFDEVIDPEIEKEDKRTGQVVPHDTNVAAVVPAWHILKLVLGEDAVKRRKKAEEDADAYEEHRTEIVTDAVTEESFTEAVFDDALFRATRITEPGESAPEGSGT